MVSEGGWRERSVLVTGHTGFKGSWLSLLLAELGAAVHGYALDPPTEPSLFALARVGERLVSDTRADLADKAALFATVEQHQPAVIFHLAAQPIVLTSYHEPLQTFATNVMGTAHVLETARQSDSVRAVVVVTTDKVYVNQEWLHPYREHDPLGGHDPYSASKAAAEIVTMSYRASFFGAAGHPARVASARAGNVIGGGDWANNRLVPDCLAAFAKGTPVVLRNPASMRPWQHVLEPLAGYLRLAERLLDADGARYASAWNFGPDVGDNATVGEVATQLAALWGPEALLELGSSQGERHEAALLSLDSTLARVRLGWRPRWSLQQALAATTEWFRAWCNGEDMAAVTLAQLRRYRGEQG